MDTAIRKMRIKFIVTATVISFTLIAIMIIMLNLLMMLSYKNESQMAADMISQAAFLNADSDSREKYVLADIPKNQDGDYIIPVNANNISAIVLHGKITAPYTDDSEWYCGGGGIMFSYQKENEDIITVHKEYIFNRNDTYVTVDFSDFSNVMYGSEYVNLDNGKIIGNGMIISRTWWTASGNVPDGTSDDKVKIELEMAEVIYKSSAEHSYIAENIRHRNFNDIFNNDIPAAISSISSFYIITDNENNITEINSGNLMNEVSDEMADKCISQTSELQKDSGIINAGNGISYKYMKKSKDDINITVFIYNGAEYKTMKNLIFISMILSISLLGVLFIIILKISASVTEPVRIAFEKQKQFISNASHELKTPVTVISATADLLKTQPNETKWIDCIKEQSEKMGQLVHELLTLAKISEISPDKKNFEQFDISRTVSNTLLSFECYAYEANRTLSSEIAENIMFSGDEGKISQLAGILIDNAIKYSAENTDIKVKLYQQKNKVILECSNHCANIENFNADRIFERFYRSDKAHSDEKKGFGLGLSIAQLIVEYHSGNISASSEGDIVTFTVAL